MILPAVATDIFRVPVLLYRLYLKLLTLRLPFARRLVRYVLRRVYGVLFAGVLAELEVHRIELLRYGARELGPDGLFEGSGVAV